MRFQHAAVLLASLLIRGPIYAQEAQLPGTSRLEVSEEVLPDVLMDGAHQFVERKINDAAANRHQYWRADKPKAVELNRKLLQTIVGAVDDRLPAKMEYFGGTSDSVIAFESDYFSVAQVRWQVIEGVFGEGLLLTPNSDPVAAAIVVPDASQVPEQLVGMVDGIPNESQITRKLIANNVQVLIPILVSRDKLETEDPRLQRSDQTNREWLYRQAFHMGRHVIGYEVQKVLAAVDWMKAEHREQNEFPIGVAGYGDGAQIAFYSAAIDTRIDAALISGYFSSREEVWKEPIDRNVWSLLQRFGDAEIASLIEPRRLIIEHSDSPAISGQKGEWKTPPFESVATEVNRVRKMTGSDALTFVHGLGSATVQPYSPPAANNFLGAIGVSSPKAAVGPVRDKRKAFSAQERQQRAVKQIQVHVQSLVRQSEHVRDQFMLYSIMPELKGGRWSTEKQHSLHDPTKFSAGTRDFRRRFYEDAIGRFDEPYSDFNTRTRKILETDKWIAYDVVLDVYTDLIAWGVLLVPKDLKPNENRPVVVCQHGRNGVPRDTVDANKSAYNDFAAKLADRGFVTFAPHNLYRGEDRYRVLDRKANTIGCTLFSFIVAQHDQILRWLATQSFVDSERIAFYGLSYGGETAVRVPTILEGYCLSICSGDFNQWTRKVAATDQPFSFMHTIEWEMPYWNLGHTFDYAEMTYLMFPRPFMVERGHHDRVGRDRWVAHEFAKVRWLYAQFGLVDRVDIEFFQGGTASTGKARLSSCIDTYDGPIQNATANSAICASSISYIKKSPASRPHWA